MSITDELRRMLDERGVKWEDCGNGATYVEHNGEAWRFDYDELFDQLVIVCLSGYTPAQAIAATLGDIDATAARHDVVEDARSLIDDEVHRDCEYYVYSQLRDCIDVIDDDYEQLKAENAKLRELIADVHEALCSDKAGMFHKLILASMEDDMCELGIEVDDA